LVLGYTETWSNSIQESTLQCNEIMNNKNGTLKGASRSHQSVLLQMLVGDEPQQHSDGLSSEHYANIFILCMNNKYCPKGWKYSNSVFMKQGKTLLYWIGTIEKRMLRQTNGKETWSTSFSPLWIRTIKSTIKMTKWK